MPTFVTMSSNNQIVLPKEAREKLRIGPGQKLLVLTKDDRLARILHQYPGSWRRAGATERWAGTKVIAVAMA